LRIVFFAAICRKYAFIGGVLLIFLFKLASLVLKSVDFIVGYMKL